tara:strand:+ start:59 stop:1783 length:1725 start_codon:yes stop_codon:yes gene_type:complete
MKSWNSFSQELTEKKAKKDYDGDGKVESGSKEHAGVVHNAIQRAKGKKADGQDTRKEEVELDENRRAARSAGGYKDDSKKQTDPSKDGFTGIGNMSIDQIRKMSARIEKDDKKKKTKKEEFQAIGEKKDPCWDTHKQVGMKKKGGRMVPNCVPKEEVEVVDERYKGKHGQSEKEYKDGRSQGGKMVSGDSKMSGAEYTHGRRVKAANPGSQPDEGGKTKPKSQGKMDKGTRADLEYRKANLKKKEQKEETELQELDIKGAVKGALNKGSEFMKKNPVGRAVGNVLKPVGPGRGTARPSVRTLNTIRQNQQSQMNSFEPEGDQIDEFLGGKPGDGYIGHPNLDIKNPLAKKQVKKPVLPGSKGGGMVNRVGASMGDRNMRLKNMLNQSHELEGEMVEGYDKPDEKLKTGRKMFTIPDEERSAAAARLKEKARKKREEKCKKEELEIQEGSCGSSKKKKKTYKEEAESKAQQRLMGLALSVKRGDTPMSSVTPQVARMAREMKEKDLKDFAGTKHDGLPEKVKKEEPEVSSPLVESLVESAVQRMAAKARRETAADKRLNRQASSAQQRAELNAKK